MPIEINSTYWPSIIKGKPNYSAYLFDHFDDIAAWRSWNPSTQEKYKAIYNNYILPIIPLDKPIEDFDSTDYLLFCDHIFEDYSSDFSSGYIEQIIYLFACVYNYGVHVKDFEDNLYIDKLNNFDGDLTDSKVIKKREKLAIARSFTIRSQILIALWIKSKDPLNCDFHDLGFSLMFFTGMRVSETCGLCFGNIKKICKGRVSAVIVAESTKIKSKEHKPGSKTKNAARIIPIPDFLFEFIQKRRETYKSAGFSDDEIDLLSVVSDSSGEGIAAVELSSYIRVLFKSFKIKPDDKPIEIFSDEQFAALIVDLNQQRKSESGFYREERDLTAYVLRRNFATVNSSLGLTDTELQFVMGHEVEGDNRSFYLNDDSLELIAEKMSYNPVYSIFSDEPFCYHENVKKYNIKGNSLVTIIHEITDMS